MLTASRARPRREFLVAAQAQATAEQGYRADRHARLLGEVGDAQVGRAREVLQEIAREPALGRRERRQVRTQAGPDARRG